MPFEWIINRKGGHFVEKIVPDEWMDWVKNQIGETTVEAFESWGPGTWVVVESGAYILSSTNKETGKTNSRRVFFDGNILVDQDRDSGFRTRVYRIRPLAPEDSVTEIPDRFGKMSYSGRGQTIRMGHAGQRPRNVSRLLTRRRARFTL